MKTLKAFYFSGTGNTQYVVRRLCDRVSTEYTTETFDVADRRNRSAVLRQADCILLAFPVYGSSPPVPMRRFVHAHAADWQGKDVVIVVTQYMFSGDGAASLGRTVERYGGRVVAAEHFRMPNNLADCKALRIRNGPETAALVRRTDERIDRFARRLLAGRAWRRGFNPLSHAVGYCCQRALWRRHEDEKKSQLKIDASVCTGCGACVSRCPTGNLRLQNGKAVPLKTCALCYRCVNLCPRRAITLVGKAPPVTQYKGPPR